MTRRDFLRLSGYGLGAIAAPICFRLPTTVPVARPFRMAVITDLHHGLAPDAESRLKAFETAVRQHHDLDVTMQMGDFCYSQPESQPVIKLFSNLPGPKIHVLGNHDMDKCDKAAAMKAWGMPSRYGVHEFEHLRIIVLDLNHFEKDGKLVDYANGNYYIDNATFNKADPEQLEWLAAELRRGSKPTLLVSHQPLGFAEPKTPMPIEQVEVLKVVTTAAKDHPKGAVAMCMFGHLHVDRLEHFEGIPCYCLNSASYFWGGGMFPYSHPLFAFMELTTDGHVNIHGGDGVFTKAPPASTDSVIGRSASIANRRIAESLA